MFPAELVVWQVNQNKKILIYFFENQHSFQTKTNLIEKSLTKICLVCNYPRIDKKGNCYKATRTNLTYTTEHSFLDIREKLESCKLFFKIEN